MNAKETLTEWLAATPVSLAAQVRLPDDTTKQDGIEIQDGDAGYPPGVAGAVVIFSVSEA